MAQPNASQTGTLLSDAVNQNSICNVTTDNEKLQYLPNDNCYDNNDVADGNWNDEFNDEYDDFDHDNQNIVLSIADKYDAIELVDDDSDDEVIEQVDVHENENNIDLNDPIVVEPSLNDISSKILLEYQQFVKDKSATNCPLSDNMVAGIELLSLLRASGCSLMLYEKIIYWVEKRIPHVMTDRLPTREKIIKIMEDRHSLQCVAPQKKEVVLPSINLPIEIPYNPILGCIYSLLSDENLMHGVNLIFPDAKQPFKAVPFTNNYSEVNSGLAYQSFQKRIKHFGNAVQVPLIF